MTNHKPIKTPKNFTTNTDIALTDIIAQMEKELQMSGENHIFCATAPGSLINELADYLDGMQCGRRISNLFYRIDISPSKADAHLPYYTALSELAWNRVFKKVWVKKKYSSLKG